MLNSATASAGSQGAPKSPGPQRRHDPHATLGPEGLIRVALQHERESRRELAIETLTEAIGRYPDAADSPHDPHVLKALP